MDWSSLHGGCPVIRGSKMIMTAWIGFKPYFVDADADTDAEGDKDSGKGLTQAESSSHACSTSGEKCEL